MGENLDHPVHDRPRPKTPTGASLALRGAAWGFGLGLLAAAAIGLQGVLAVTTHIDGASESMLEGLAPQTWSFHLNCYADLLDMELIVPPLLWLFLLACACGLAGALASLVGHHARFDPRRLVTSSVTWAIRVLFSRHWVWIFLGFSLGLMLLAYWTDKDWIAFILLGASGIVLVLLPFSILRQEVLRSKSGGNWYRPSWPGIGPLLEAALLGLLMGLIALACSWVSRWHDVTEGVCLFLAPYIIFLLVMAQISVFLERPKPREALSFLRSKFAWNVLGPWTLLYLRGIVIISFVAVMVSLMKIILDDLELRTAFLIDRGLDVPLWWKATAHSLMLLIKYGPATEILLTFAFFLLAGGRLAAQTASAQPGEGKRA